MISCSFCRSDLLLKYIARACYCTKTTGAYAEINQHRPRTEANPARHPAETGNAGIISTPYQNGLSNGMVRPDNHAISSCVNVPL